jgi:hypothetical protein
MALSEEARRRFAHVVDETDPSSANPEDDAALLGFAAWALVHQPDALQERFALESMMSERGLIDIRMRYIMIVLRTSAALVAAYERERASADGSQPEAHNGGQPDHGR